MWCLRRLPKHPDNLLTWALGRWGTLVAEQVHEGFCPATRTRRARLLECVVRSHGTAGGQEEPEFKSIVAVGDILSKAGFMLRKFAGRHVDGAPVSSNRMKPPSPSLG